MLYYKKNTGMWEMVMIYVKIKRFPSAPMDWMLRRLSPNRFVAAWWRFKTCLGKLFKWHENVLF